MSFSVFVSWEVGPTFVPMSPKMAHVPKNVPMSPPAAPCPVPLKMQGDVRVGGKKKNPVTNTSEKIDFT